MAIRRIHQGIEPLEARTLLAAAGPTITAATPAELFNLKTESLTALTVSFSEAVNASSFTAEDVKIVGPDGPIAPASIDTFDDQEFTIEIPAQTRRGIYRVTVGPQITNLGGNAMDQNQNGTAGEGADAYSWSFSAFNADPRFTKPFTIPAGNRDYENQDIAIIGTTLTIDGAHSFNSIQLMKGAVVTYTAGPEAGLSLSVAIAEDAIVDATSAINADGKGYPGMSGPGVGQIRCGAGHGGMGGSCNAWVGGGIYGSLTSPSEWGSGGGYSSWGGEGAGGGAVALTVGRTLTVNGAVRAQGELPCTTGGAGGSIWLTAGTLAGDGVISVNGGGNGIGSQFSAGGGGRIAIYYNTCTFTGITSAYGGLGLPHGGAGTIYRKSANQPLGELLVDNGGKVGAPTPLPPGTYNLDILQVTGGAILPLPAGAHTVDAVIVGSGANMNVPNEAALEFRRCDVQSGGSLSMEGSCADDPGDILDVEKEGTLTLNGNWINKGTFSARGTATLQGTWTNEAGISIDGPGTLQGKWANNGTISVGDVTVMQEDWVNSGTISVNSVAILKDTWTNNGIIAVTGQLIVRPPQDAIVSTYDAVYSQLRSGVLGKIPRIWTNVNEDPQPCTEDLPCTAVGSFFNGYPNDPNLTSFAGQSVQKGDILCRYTYFGDANMDGVVNADDYFLIDSAFLCQGGPLAAGEPEPAEAASEQSAVVTRVQPQKNEADQSILSQLFSTEPVM